MILFIECRESINRQPPNKEYHFLLLYLPTPDRFSGWREVISAGVMAFSIWAPLGAVVERNGMDNERCQDSGEKQMKVLFKIIARLADSSIADVEQAYISSPDFPFTAGDSCGCIVSLIDF